jgi:hypothetical protein
MTDPDQLASDIFVEIERIDRMVAYNDHMWANHAYKRHLAPWVLAIMGFGAGAALYAGGVALMKAFGG